MIFFLTISGVVCGDKRLIKEDCKTTKTDLQIIRTGLLKGFMFLNNALWILVGWFGA